MKLFQHLFHSVGTTICVCLVEFVAFVTILHSLQSKCSSLMVEPIPNIHFDNKYIIIILRNL